MSDAFVVVDPGIRGSGVALFDHAGRLLVADYVKNSVDTGGGPRACFSMAREIAIWSWGHDRVVFEWPRVYTQGKRTGNPNDLLPLVGICLALVALKNDGLATSYYPNEWKGSMAKGRAFTARVLSRLSPEEQAAIKDAKHLSHNVLDAVGIGLHHLGRFKPRRVIAR